jgi:hypothetical protein
MDTHRSTGTRRQFALNSVRMQMLGSSPSMTVRRDFRPPILNLMTARSSRAMTDGGGRVPKRLMLGVALSGLSVETLMPLIPCGLIRARLLRTNSISPGPS